MNGRLRASIGFILMGCSHAYGDPAPAGRASVGPLEEVEVWGSRSATILVPVSCQCLVEG